MRSPRSGGSRPRRATRGLGLAIAAGAILLVALVVIRWGMSSRRAVGVGTSSAPAPSAPSAQFANGPRLLVVHGADPGRLRRRLVAVLGQAELERLDLDLERRHISGSVATTQLAVRALARERRRELEEALELFADELADRFSPAPLGLFEGSPTDDLTQLIARLLPTLTASRALLVKRWLAPDGTLVVIPRSTCPRLPSAAADVRCLEAWSGELPARIRFTAWPVATAALLRYDHPTTARQAAEALRASRPNSTIALVASADDLSGTSDVAARSRRAAARGARLLRRLPDSAHRRALPLLQELAASPSNVAPDWLSLGPGELLVVPRLGKLAMLDAFTREIERTLAAAGLLDRTTWRRRPTAF